ncbi:hypothetical protein SPSIL_040200 [Sporomusa silvacetica DSM 10669]|uniref:Flavodoxin-like domain-containing protein n=1 Tax=Sporomusa silvacetica DSM 10669 TaxID=1123289 RepID=A0ABZ3IQI2_9FIRM|nr:flavodoxin [Sporomusa silvacetica]OZC16325.1 flavodoxin [Sporomusa silvacetica DSM 10669]
MKKIITLVLAIVMLLTAAGCGSTGATFNAGSVSSGKISPGDNAASTKKHSKILVAYFSHGGNTRKAAESIHEQVGGDLFEIKTVNPYPEEYDACVAAAKAELENNARPQLTGKVENMADYDIVFIGYPIWWHTTPMAIYSFMEAYDLSGKTVIPFCTSYSNDIAKSMPAIHGLAANSKILDGLTIKGVDGENVSKVEPWLKKIGIVR